MSRFLAGGLVLAVIAGAWLYLRGGKGEKTATTQSAGEATSGSAAGANEPTSGKTGAPLPAPRRMTSKDPQPTPVGPQATAASLSEAFASEAPAAGAQGERTEMIRGVVDGLVSNKVGDAKIAGLECRARHCLLKIAGDDQEGVVTLVDALQDERGFLGKAESLMMSRDEESIHIYLRFAE
jgi:hypothetical protein